MKTSKTKQKRYILPKAITKDNVIAELKKHFNIKQTESLTENISILDSYEWGLYYRKLLAIKSDNNEISIYNEADIFDAQAFLKTEKLPAKKLPAKIKFWWEMPDSKVKDVLKDILDLRALCAVFEGQMDVAHISLQDEHGKTVVYCQFISISSSANGKPINGKSGLLNQVKITPVTGYNKENKQAITLILNLGGFESRLSPLDSLFGAVGLIPQPYVSKPEFNLSANIPARVAISSIVALMLKKQRQMEEGIINDIDSEFLHQFRVALRMTRAAIAQLKEVFSQADAQLLKNRFAILARETNYLRDLDVFIIEKQRYIDLLPQSLGKGLGPMFDDFKKSRESEALRISKWLSGKSYQQEIIELESLFINGYSSIETQWSEKPCIELAVKKIQKRYKKIQYASANIAHDTPDADIHRIRIDCKKLRYLLYFFNNLFNDISKNASKKRSKNGAKNSQVKLATDHLKSLQGKLGNFNDFSVQGEFLEKHLYETNHKPKKDILLIASLGGLISSLHNLQVQEREKCINELAVFSNTENQSLFKQTFCIK